MGPRDLAPPDIGTRPFASPGAWRLSARVIWAIAVCAPLPLHAQDAAPPAIPPPAEAREAAAKQDTSPLSAHVSFTQFLEGPVSGGVEREASYGGRIDVEAKVDTRLLGLWRGGSLDAKLATRYGESASGNAGVVIPVNVPLVDPASTGTSTALVALTYTQTLALGSKPGNLLLLAVGKFYTVDLAPEVLMGGGGITHFMNLSQLAPPDEGRNIPSVSNGASLAVVLAGEPVFSFALLDPQPSQRTSGLDSLFEKGVTLAPTVIVPTRFFGLPGHQSVRGSWSSQRVTPFDEIPQLILPRPANAAGVEREGGTWSATWSADQFISASPKPPLTGWGVFWQVSFADAATNPVSSFFNLGLGGNSPIGGRAADFWGVAWSRTSLSGDFKELFAPLVELRDEKELEAYYNVSIAPWLRLTADLQVLWPSRPGVETVVLPGVRLQLVF